MARTATKKFVVSRKAQAVDRIGEIDQLIAELETERSALIEKINLKPTNIIGTEFKARVYEMTSTWLDHKRVKRALGIEGYAKCFRRKTVIAVRVTPLADADEDTEE